MPSNCDNVYKKLTDVIQGYIDKNKNSIWKCRSIFGTAGVPRAKQLLNELKQAQEAKPYHENEFLAIVGQNKYDTGSELKSLLINTVLNLSHVDQKSIDARANQLAGRLNDANKQITGMLHPVMLLPDDPTSTRIQDLARYSLFYLIVAEAKRDVEKQKTRLIP